MDNINIVKLKTGETLFCLVEPNINNSRFVNVEHPLLIKTTDMGDNTESLYAARWIPYTNYFKFTIPVDTIVLIAPLNSSFKKFYGMTRLKAELYDLNNLAVNKIINGELIENVLPEIFSEIDKLYESIVISVGDLDFDVNDFKKHIETEISKINKIDFEQINEPKLVLH